MKEQSMPVGDACGPQAVTPMDGWAFAFGIVSFVLLVLSAVGVVVSHAGMPRVSSPVSSVASNAANELPPTRSPFDNLMTTPPPLETLIGSASAGDACAQEILGFALLEAADKPDLAVLIPDALYWLERAHDNGSRRAVDGLLHVFARHCGDSRLRDQAVCQPGE